MKKLKIIKIIFTIISVIVITLAYTPNYIIHIPTVIYILIITLSIVCVHYLYLEEIKILNKKD